VDVDLIFMFTFQDDLTAKFNKLHSLRFLYLAGFREIFSFGQKSPWRSQASDSVVPVLDLGQEVQNAVEWYGRKISLVIQTIDCLQMVDYYQSGQKPLLNHVTRCLKYMPR
jgi:hypothetical protein